MRKQKRIIATIVAIIILITGSVTGNTTVTKASELDYSSSKVAKVTKVKTAYKVLGMFNGLDGPKAKYNSPTKSGYFLVTDKRFKTMKALKKYLKKYFSNGYTKKLLKDKTFISKKGKLYFRGGDRGSNISYQKTEYKIIKKTSNYRKIKATSYYYHEDYVVDNPVVVSIYKQRKINGRWVFTSIELPY